MAEKAPDADTATLNKYMLEVKAKTQTGKVVPITVIKRQYLRPIVSESFPNNGQAKNANNPLIVSMIPTMKYVYTPKVFTSIPGNIDLGILKAKYS